MSLLLQKSNTIRQQNCSNFVTISLNCKQIHFYPIWKMCFCYGGIMFFPQCSNPPNSFPKLNRYMYLPNFTPHRLRMDGGHFQGWCMKSLGRAAISGHHFLTQAPSGSQVKAASTGCITKFHWSSPLIPPFCHIIALMATSASSKVSCTNTNQCLSLIIRRLHISMHFRWFYNLFLSILCYIIFSNFIIHNKYRTRQHACKSNLP